MLGTKLHLRSSSLSVSGVKRMWAEGMHASCSKPVPSKAHTAPLPPHSDLGDTSQMLLWASGITSWEEPWSSNQNLFAVSSGLWSEKAIPFIILTCRFLGLCLMVAGFIHSNRTSTGTYLQNWCWICLWMHGSCVIFYILAWKVSGKNTNYDVMIIWG